MTILNSTMNTLQVMAKPFGVTLKTPSALGVFVCILSACVLTALYYWFVPFGNPDLLIYAFFAFFAGAFCAELGVRSTDGFKPWLFIVVFSASFGFAFGLIVSTTMKRLS